MEKADETQVDTLAYAMGGKADDILRSFHLTLVCTLLLFSYVCPTITTLITVLFIL